MPTIDTMPNGASWSSTMDSRVSVSIDSLRAETRILAERFERSGALTPQRHAVVIVVPHALLDVIDERSHAAIVREAERRADDALRVDADLRRNEPGRIATYLVVPGATPLYEQF